MKLKDLVRSVQAELPITMRMDKWLTNPNPEYSPEALAHANAALSHSVGGQRAGRQPFRSSGVGSCHRRQLFRAVGVPERDAIDSKLGNTFATGNFLHLKWQMAGLTEGWLTQAEVPADFPPMRFGGTLDGILYDNSGFEFKTIHSNGFGQVMAYGPKPEHILQVHSYMMITAIDVFSVVYENKDTGEWREWRVPKDDKIDKQVQRSLDELVGHYEKGTLPPMLSDCETKEGTTYRNCPYNKICPTQRKLPLVVDGRVVGR